MSTTVSLPLQPPQSASKWLRRLFKSLSHSKQLIIIDFTTCTRSKFMIGYGLLSKK
jgi:hypothetical protein